MDIFWNTPFRRKQDRQLYLVLREHLLDYSLYTRRILEIAYPLCSPKADHLNSYQTQFVNHTNNIID